MAKDSTPPTEDSSEDEPVSDTAGPNPGSTADSESGVPSSEEALKTDSKGGSEPEADAPGTTEGVKNKSRSDPIPDAASRRLAERIINKAGAASDNETSVNSPDNNFTIAAAYKAGVPYVEVKQADIGEYTRELAPSFTGRYEDLIRALMGFVNQGTQTVSLSTLAKQVDPDWNLKIQRQYLKDIERAGAVDKVRALDNNSREPAQIHKTLLRHLHKDHVAFSKHKEAKYIIDYMWSADQQASDPSSDVTEDAQIPRKGWLYGIVRKFAEPPARTINPKFHVEFRQLGRPNHDDPEWQADFDYEDVLFPNQDFYDHIDQYAVLIDIHFEDLEIVRPGLESRLEEELVNYHAATLHDNEVAIGGVATGDPEDYLEKKADPTVPDGHSPPIAQVPWFDYDATVDADVGTIRLQSLYQQESA